MPHITTEYVQGSSTIYMCRNLQC